MRPSVTKEPRTKPQPHPRRASCPRCRTGPEVRSASPTRAADPHQRSCRGGWVWGGRSVAFSFGVQRRKLADGMWGEGNVGLVGGEAGMWEGVDGGAWKRMR